MTLEERLAQVVFVGIQYGRLPETGIALCSDPLTRTTFALHERESLVDALHRVDARFADGDSAEAAA